MFKIDIHTRLKGSKRKLDLSFAAEFDVGELNFLLGPSGVGKTAIFRMLSGLENANEGFISYDKKLWYSSDNDICLTIKERNVGMVFQQANLFPNMSVMGNLEYALSGKITGEIRSFCKYLNVDGLLHEKPRFLSGGEKQRILIIRSLCMRSDVLLLDEPFSALDDSTAERVLDLLQTIQRERKFTILLTTHRGSLIKENGNCVVQI